MSNTIDKSASYLAAYNIPDFSGAWKSEETKAGLTPAAGQMTDNNSTCFPQLPTRASGISDLYRTLVTMIQSLMQMLEQMLGLTALNSGSPIGGSDTLMPPGNTTGGVYGEEGVSAPGGQSAASPSPGSSALPAAEATSRALSTTTGADGNLQVATRDGWLVKCQGREQDWTITNSGGKATRMWGDPHVVESDGDTFDFTRQSSFRFGDNKVTVEVAPYGDSGKTLTKTITIYNGNERVTITGIDENKPRVAAASDDGQAHDRAVLDGDVYYLGKEANGDDQWHKVEERGMTEGVQQQ